MPYCGDNVAVKMEGPARRAVTLKCNAWTCPDCLPKRQKQLMAEALGGSPWTFLTLTLRRRPGADALQAAKLICRAWRLLRYRIMRRFKLQRLPFFAVMEATKAGWPHLHIMLRAPFIPWQWLRVQWIALTGSERLKVEAIRTKKGSAAYVAKYCSEAPVKFGTCKRYWQSQDYDLRDDPPAKPRAAPGEGWERHPYGLAKFIRIWTELGYRIERPDAWSAIAWPIDQASLPPQARAGPSR